jgi:hypothetical protein
MTRLLAPSYQLTGVSFVTAMEMGDFLSQQGFLPSSEGFFKFETLDNLRIDASYVLTMGRCYLKTKALPLPEGIQPVDDHRGYTIGICNSRYCIVNDRGTCVGGFHPSVASAQRGIDQQLQDEFELACRTVLIVEGENAGTVAVVQKRDPLMISGGYQLTLVTKEGKNLWVHEDKTILLVESRHGFHICHQRSGRYSVHDAKGEKVLDFYQSVKDAADAIDAVEREAAPYAMSKAKRYSVEQQADGTHAIFCNGGFIKGGYPSYDRTKALSDARDMAEADEECGVPVMARAE